MIYLHKMTNLNRRKGYLNNLLAQMTKNANLTTKVDQPKEDQAKVDPEAAQADRVVDQVVDQMVDQSDRVVNQADRVVNQVVDQVVVQAEECLDQQMVEDSFLRPIKICRNSCRSKFWTRRQTNVKVM
jgi:hypothetical protein